RFRVGMCKFPPRRWPLLALDRRRSGACYCNDSARVEVPFTWRAGRCMTPAMRRIVWIFFIGAALGCGSGHGSLDGGGGSGGGSSGGPSGQVLILGRSEQGISSTNISAFFFGE